MSLSANKGFPYRLLLSQLYAHRLSTVLHHLAFRILEVKGTGGILRDKHYVEATVLQHTVKTTLTGTERDGTSSLVIGDVDGGVLAPLIIIVLH